jgi:sulfur-carrier protein adenylyltransferase/sulfurtransferase
VNTDSLENRNLGSPEERELSDSERLRYSRHITLEEFGLQSQLKLKAAKVLIVGAGGLGNPVGLYLAGAGVGTIGVADFDQVSLSNLHRQVAFKTAEIGRSKVDGLIATMKGINPELCYVAHNIQIDARNVDELIGRYDLVIDGSDNFATRFLLADACYLHKIALLHGAVHKFQAQVALFDSKTACFRCLYREPPGADALPPCVEAGILNVVTGATGLIMATESVKYLTGLNTPSLGTVLIYDALAQSIRKVDLSADSDCPLCGSEPKIIQVEGSIACSTLPSDSSAKFGLSVEEAKRLLADGALLIDVRNPEEFAQEHIEGAILMPLHGLDNGATKGLDRKETIVAYCKTGKRSALAVEKLRAIGLERVYSITGGIDAWNQVTT